MFFLDNQIKFPNVELASPEGIIGIGGDLSPERLITAYKSGIFPWYNEDEPIIWYSPDPRMVLKPSEIKISKSMKQVINKNIFHFTFNQEFEFVINACKTIDRNDQNGTWITDDMKASYIKLHNLGIAKSLEVWQENEIVGGLYGIDLGHIFCGESMFSKVSNASKFAFIKLAKKLEKENYSLIDCQVYNDHLASLGASEIPRKQFISLLKNH